MSSSIHANMALYSETPFVFLLSLAHFRIMFLSAFLAELGTRMAMVSTTEPPFWPYSAIKRLIASKNAYFRLFLSRRCLNFSNAVTFGRFPQGNLSRRVFALISYRILCLQRLRLTNWISIAANTFSASFQSSWADILTFCLDNAVLWLLAILPTGWSRLWFAEALLVWFCASLWCILCR